MKLNKKVLMASLVLASSVAGAEGISYYGGAKINSGGLYFSDADIAPIVGLGLGGGIKYNFNKAFIGGELYFNYALTDPEAKLNNGTGTGINFVSGISEEVNFIFGYNFTEKFGMYGLIGIYHYKPSMEISGINVSYDSITTAQCGIGFTYKIDEKISFKLQGTASNPEYKVGGGVGAKAALSTGSLGLTYTF